MIKFQTFDNAQREEAQQINVLTGATKLQSIPFIVMTDGPAKVENYFDKKTKEDNAEIFGQKNKKILLNSFHGRGLKGSSVQLSKDVIGVAYERTVGREINYKPTAVFKELTYWKHDEIPSESDKIHQIAKFAQIMHEFHQD